ncbi:methyltransferase domain-containing protein [Niveispirillum sp. SYP-B3756]|uniref:methyltransferase domain-containing protein n=1 Tax=Niveispirillum sp. SYP-B3756 TaxID=2662178 RepID=UPI001290E211|nr:methyltransferase domain-containing protein [Niveispirillum sp. SYP-B3756]MQP65209.1 methyltransferase domain-containing protein [Niveispirillum sp. SYP-B3756]
MTNTLARAFELLDQGDRSGAIAILYQATEQGAGGEIAGLLAELRAEDGEHEQAVALFTRALADDPGHGPWRRASLTSLMQLPERRGQARRFCAEMLAQRGDEPVAHRHMARLCLEVGEREAAVAHAREAIFLAPHDLESLRDIAFILTAAGEPLPAVEALATALAQAHPADPALPFAMVAQARGWLALAEPAKASANLRRALELDPDDLAGAQSLLDQLAAADVPADLPATFVRALFDTYADRFDRELVGRLHYDAPGALRALLDEQGVGGGRDILDAGCGTGLAGLAVRDMARHLAGFDLSPRMVEKARARDIYNELWVGELVESLSQRPRSADLLLAADVLVYLGDLRPVMAAAAKVLRPGGLFAFTCEWVDQPDGFLLHEGRRFAHSEFHVREALAQAGFTIRTLRHHSTRTDRGQPVPGLICLAGRA